MNDYARRMIRDGRNPYGSRGGYVTSRDPRRRDRRDRGEYDTMDGRYERDGHHMGYEEPYGRLRGEFEYEQYDDYDCYDYGDYRGGDMRGRGRGMRRDYGDDWDDEDMRGRARNSRGQYMSRRGRRDYGEDEEELTKHDIKKWEKDMENSDGTHGAHFEKEMIDQKTMQMGIDPKKFGDGVLCVMVNSMYSDYCGVAKKFGVDRIEFYIEMAKAFLDDKDFDGSPEEKAYLYYKCIVEHD